MRALSLLILTLVSGAVCAAPLSTYQSRWAQIKYQLKPKKQEKLLKVCMMPSIATCLIMPVRPTT